MADAGGRAPDELWERVFRALDDAGAGGADLTRLLGDDPRALALAESLCRVGDVAESGFLEHNPAEAMEGAVEGPDPMLGQRLGVFEVIETIADGGMGRVYKARRADGLYEQTVAVKILLEHLATSEARERFDIERRMLARLEHPSIARMLDGGVTADGRPYFVMEHIEGRRLDQAVRGLSLSDRLGLFERIGEAVRYAHGHMVVHRDLKPANVIVGASGEPKLLDFGIGKFLSETGDDLTTGGPRPMTPQYAAPEQLRGGAISQATDVYGLGLLLYEMITGARPYRVSGSREDAERVVCESEPTPLVEAASADTDASHWAGRLRGDLDRIVRKATAKDPEDRYASVDRLLEDLRRYRAVRPILARPSSLRYTAGLFLRRHPVSSGAMALAACSLVVGLSVAGSAYGRATEATDAERRQRVVAEEVGLFLDDMLGSLDPRIARDRDTELLGEILDRAHDRLAEGAVTDPLARARLDHRVGATYAVIGARERGLAHLSSAERLWRELGMEDDREMGATLMSMGGLALEMGRFDEAESKLLGALAIYRAADPADTKGLFMTLDHVAALRLQQGRMAEARVLLEEAIGLGASPPEAESSLQAMNKLAVVLAETGDAEGAGAMLGPIAAAVLETGKVSPTLVTTLNTMAVLRSRLGAYDEALDWHERTVRATEAVYGSGGSRTLTARANMAVTLERAGRPAEAESEYRLVLSAQNALLGPDHLDTLSSSLNLGVLLLRTERADEALSVLRPLLARNEKALGPTHPTTSITRAALGEAIAAAGGDEAIAEAAALLERAIADLTAAFGAQAGPVRRAGRVLAEIRGSGADGSEIGGP